MLIHVLLFSGTLALFVSQKDPLAAWILPDSGWFSEPVWAVLLGIFLWVLAVLFAFVGSILVGSVVCDPFYDLLSERTEEVLVGRHVGPPFSVRLILRGIAVELWATVLRLLVYGAVAIPLLLLSFTPLAFASGPLTLVWTWLFLAYEFLSRSLTRHAIDPKHRFAPLFANKVVCLGFGLGAWIVSFLPATAPFLVVGATRLYLSLAAHGRAPSKLTDEEKARLAGVAQHVPSFAAENNHSA